MEAGVFAFVAFVAAFGCAFVVGRSVFLGLERAMAATRGVAYVSQKACVRGAVNGRGARRFAASRARVRDAVCRVSLYYMRNGVASFLPFGRRIVSTPAGQSFRDAARLATRKGVDTTPEGLASLFVASALIFMAGGADNSLDQPKRLVPCLSGTAWGSSSRAIASCGARCRKRCTRPAVP